MQLFDLKNSILTINGLPMGHYGPQDAIAFEWSDDIAYHEVTADGAVVVSRTNDKRMLVTLTLVQTSSSIPILEGLLDAQHGVTAGFGPPILTPYTFSFNDYITGTRVLSEESIFLNRIAPNYGKGVSQVGYRLLLPDPEYSFGPNNVSASISP